MMRPRRLVAVVLALAAGLLALPASNAVAEEVGDGRIAFVTSRSGQWSAQTMLADGSDVRALFDDAFTVSDAAWSRDGARLALAGVQPGEESSSIYLANPNGSALTRVTLGDTDDFSPSWSPDGARIVYEQWSQDAGGWRPDLYIVNADGTGRTRVPIPAEISPGAPDWAPQGEQLVFTGVTDAGIDLYVVNTDGTGLARLTDATAQDRDGRWSPDGAQIVFSSARVVAGGSEPARIHVMAADGSARTALTSGGADRGPAWAPSGDRIVFFRLHPDDALRSRIMSMTATGSGVTALTGDDHAHVRPHWQPVTSATPPDDPPPGPEPGPEEPPGTEPGDDSPAAHACPEDRVPPSGFADTAGNVHEANIDCILWWEITRGISRTEYGPALDVRRDQMASFLARMILNAGGSLPPPSDQGFTDIAGNVHADNINRLAAAGVARGTSATTFSPAAPVRRDQMASFLIRAYEHLARESLTASREHFTDIAGNVHRENINKAAEARMAAGTTPTTFSPAASVRRDQMASFIARALGVAVERGRLSPPV